MTRTRRPLLYLQIRRTVDSPWRVDSRSTNERMMLDTLRETASALYADAQVRLVTGNPYSGEIEDVIAIRFGQNAR